VLVKSRIADINVRHGQDGLVFKGDLRISISTEKNLGTPYQLSPTAEL